MTPNPMPDALRRALEDDLAPVRPLPPAWRRTVVAAVVASGVLVVTLVVLRLRPDLDQLPMWLAWGCTFLELLVGILLVGLALRESVPGGGAPLGIALLAVAAALLVQVVVAICTWVYSPGMPLGASLFSQGMGCLRHDSTIALPTFVVVLWLVFRALPTRAPLAGLLGGLGAAIAADAVLHLLCPISDLRHVLVWHTGGLVLFMALGFLAGFVWDRLRWRR